MSKGEKRSRMPVHKKAEKAHQKNTSPPLFVFGRLQAQFDRRPWKSKVVDKLVCERVSWLMFHNIKINTENNDCFQRNGYNGQNEEKGEIIQ